MYEKINKYGTSPILQRLAGETPKELTPSEFILVRTGSLFYSCSFMNRLLMANFAQECPDINNRKSIGLQKPGVICVHLRSSAVKKFQKTKQLFFINLDKSQQAVDQLMQILRGHNIVGITKNLPKEFRSSPPGIENIEAELRGENDE